MYVFLLEKYLTHLISVVISKVKPISILKPIPVSKTNSLYFFKLLISSFFNPNL
jgi:hypothetical protein